VEEVSREKSRANRSRAALSVAVFKVDSTATGESKNLRTFLDLLRRIKRETDSLGYVGRNKFAVLLLYTTAEGAERFVNKVAGIGSGFLFEGGTGTYPDGRFDMLLDLDLHVPKGALPSNDETIENYKGEYALKRPLDVIFSLFLILLFAPLMLLVAVAVAATSPGPVLFKQTRIGKGGKPFTFYKFRSMAVNSDDRIHREYVARLIEGETDKVNEGDSSRPLYKIKSDPRITSVGRIIRKTSIDELPQLFNVLKGDMSLVGPRPPVPYEVERYQNWHLLRVLGIKPGITGLWQVEGRSKTTFDEMVRLDVRYMRYCSLRLDLKILFKTIAVVLRCDGAN
jgi:lipopolysaccharide/colanic/teichoic acid biosynthesis glycosyltransferase